MNYKIFGTLFVSIFSVILGVGIVTPLLPVFAHDLGAGGFCIGMVFGSFSLSRTFFLPIFGYLSDIKGRKPFIIAGLFSYALISIAFMYVNDPYLLIVCRFFQGIASAMILPVVQAYVGEMTPKGQEGLQMASFNISMFASLSIGPILGGYIQDQWDLQAAFVVMGMLAFASFLAALVFLPSTKNEQYRKKREDKVPWRYLIKNHAIIGLFSYRFAYTTCIGILWGFLPVYADASFNLSHTEIGILIMLGVFISGLFHVPMGYLADRVDQNIMIVLGGSIVAISIFSMELAYNFWGLFAINCLFGIGGGISMPAVTARAVIQGKKMNVMGSVMALLTMGHSLGMMCGALLAGIIMEFHRLQTSFYIGGWIMIASLIIFFCALFSKK
jgi:MFS family permease